MKSTAAAVFVLLLGIFATTKAQTQVNCNFAMSSGLYSCMIFGLTITDNENQFFVIGGTHQPGLTNAHVERVQIQFSTIPFVIPQFFITFPNLVDFQVLNSGLTRIQTNAFANAARLRTVSILDNQLFRTIHANAFLGAADIRDIQLRNNQLEVIHENAFNGIGTLQGVNMDNNNIIQLHHNVFRPLANLVVLSLADNYLHTIDGRLLSDNRLLSQLDLARNQINAIQRNFLDNFQTGFFFLNIVQNQCANNFWIIQGVAGLEEVRQGLAACFNNFVDPPGGDYRTYMLELRGTMVIRYENGTEIVRL